MSVLVARRPRVLRSLGVCAALFAAIAPILLAGHAAAAQGACSRIKGDAAIVARLNEAIQERGRNGFPDWCAQADRILGAFKDIGAVENADPRRCGVSEDIRQRTAAIEGKIRLLAQGCPLQN